MPKPFALICNPLSEVSIIGFSLLYLRATARIKLSGDFLLKSVGSNVKSAVSILTLRLSILSFISLKAF